MGGIALALATWLMTEKDMVVPFACMLCMECVDPKSTTSCTYLYFFDSERVVCIF